MSNEEIIEQLTKLLIQQDFEDKQKVKKEKAILLLLMNSAKI